MIKIIKRKPNHPLYLLYTDCDGSGKGQNSGEHSIIVITLIISEYK